MQYQQVFEDHPDLLFLGSPSHHSQEIALNGLAPLDKKHAEESGSWTPGQMIINDKATIPPFVYGENYECLEEYRPQLKALRHSLSTALSNGGMKGVAMLQALCSVGSFAGFLYGDNRKYNLRTLVGECFVLATALNLLHPLCKLAKGIPFGSNHLHQEFENNIEMFNQIREQAIVSFDTLLFAQQNPRDRVNAEGRPTFTVPVEDRAVLMFGLLTPHCAAYLKHRKRFRATKGKLTDAVYPVMLSNRTRFLDSLEGSDAEEVSEKSGSDPRTRNTIDIIEEAGERYSLGQEAAIFGLYEHITGFDYRDCAHSLIAHPRSKTPTENEEEIKLFAGSNRRMVPECRRILELRKELPEEDLEGMVAGDTNWDRFRNGLAAIEPTPRIKYRWPHEMFLTIVDKLADDKAYPCRQLCKFAAAFAHLSLAPWEKFGSGTSDSAEEEVCDGGGECEVSETVARVEGYERIVNPEFTLSSDMMMRLDSARQILGSMNADFDPIMGQKNSKGCRGGEVLRSSPASTNIPGWDYYVHHDQPRAEEEKSDYTNGFSVERGGFEHGKATPQELFEAGKNYFQAFDEDATNRENTSPDGNYNFCRLAVELPIFNIFASKGVDFQDVYKSFILEERAKKKAGFASATDPSIPETTDPHKKQGEKLQKQHVRKPTETLDSFAFDADEKKVPVLSRWPFFRERDDFVSDERFQTHPASGLFSPYRANLERLKPSHPEIKGTCFYADLMHSGSDTEGVDPLWGKMARAERKHGREVGVKWNRYSMFLLQQKGLIFKKWSKMPLNSVPLLATPSKYAQNMSNGTTTGRRPG